MLRLHDLLDILKVRREVDLWVNQQCPHQVSSHIFKVFCWHVHASFGALFCDHNHHIRLAYKVHPWEGTLHGEDVSHILEFLVESDPRSWLLALLDTESGVVEAEVLADFAQEKREDASLLWTFLVVTAVHKDILLPGMPVQVTEQQYSSLFIALFDELLSVIDSRMNNFRRRLPPAIEITPCQRTPIVTVNNSVRIQHRYYLENEIFSEKPSLHVVRVSDELDNAAHHPGAHSFPWMDPCWNHNALALPDIVFLLSGRYSQIITVYSCQSFAKGLSWRKPK